MTDSSSNSQNPPVQKEKPRRKYLIEAFHSLEATSPDNPCLLEELGLDLKAYNSRIEELIGNNVIICINKEKNFYYLDPQALETLQAKEFKDFFVQLVSIIIPGIIFLLLGIMWLLRT